MSHIAIRPWSRALVALGLVLLGLHALPTGSAAQDPIPGAPTQARLQGIVVEASTGQPVETALVEVINTEFASPTGRYGGFAFPDAPLGTVSIRVSAPGHPTLVQDIEVNEGRISFVQIVLPSVSATLSELLVLVQGPQESGAIRAAGNAADLLALQAPRLYINSNAVGRRDYQLNLRPGTTLEGSVTPLILIDGAVVSSAENAYEALVNIPAADVLEIEILTGPAASQYPLSANGVINVKTVRGR